MRETVYDKLRRVHEQLKKEFKQFNDRDLYEMTATLSTWHYPKKRWKSMKISKDEAMLYEFYLNNKYNPSTVYKWMLACNTNEDIQKQLMNGQIGLKKAMSKSNPYRKFSQAEQQLLFQIKTMVKKYVIR